MCRKPRFPHYMLKYDETYIVIEIKKSTKKILLNNKTIKFIKSKLTRKVCVGNLGFLTKD